MQRDGNNNGERGNRQKGRNWQENEEGTSENGSGRVEGWPRVGQVWRLKITSMP